MQQGKKVQVDWKAVLGEEVYDLQIGRFGQYLASTQTEIVALGERHLFCVSEGGKILSQRKLDFIPSCMSLVLSNPNEPLSKHHLIIGTHSHSLMVYRDPKLIWAAGTNSIVPISICTGVFG